ncbi:MAG: ABC transporter permease [Deltaproteobacteria bacterium]|jgi:putative ABC transport system permease protein|nr:ABC transporter permease [Deltaproteobacteria bacterium]
MFWKMVTGALRRQKSKRLMVALTVGLGVSLATAMLGVMFDVGDKVNQELKTYGANLTVIPRGASLAGDKYRFEGETEDASAGAEDAENYLPEDELYKIKMIFWAFNVVDFAPFLATRLTVGEGPEAREVVFNGTWFNKTLELPTGDKVTTGVMPLKSWWRLEGEPGSDDHFDGVMVGRNLAAELGLGLGSVFTAKDASGARRSMLTRGIIESGGDEDDEIFGTLAFAQAAAGLPGLAQKVEVSALTTPENDLARRAAADPESLSRLEWDAWYCTAYISSIAYQIEEALPGTRVKPVWRVAESEGAIMQKTQLLIVLLTVLTLLCSALAISNLVTANIMERSVEIGLMKALGASNLAVSLLILAETLLVAFLGGFVGYLAGLGLARFIGISVFGSQVVVKTVVIPLAVLMVLLVTLLGSLPALQAILKLKPTEVLHGR